MRRQDLPRRDQPAQVSPRKVSWGIVRSRNLPLATLASLAAAGLLAAQDRPPLAERIAAHLRANDLKAQEGEMQCVRRHPAHARLAGAHEPDKGKVVD